MRHRDADDGPAVRGALLGEFGGAMLRSNVVDRIENSRASHSALRQQGGSRKYLGDYEIYYRSHACSPKKKLPWVMSRENNKSQD